MARAIAGRLLHEPTLRLKRAAGEDDAYLYVSALRELFGLDAESAPTADADGEVRSLPDARRPQAPGELSDRLKLGTRGSPLAARAGRGWWPRRSAAPRSSPSKSADERLGDKERFVRGVERAVLDGEVDLGVHSAKDLPVRSPRGDPRWSACSSARSPPTRSSVGGHRSTSCAAGSRIGTASLRRRSQLLALRPDLELVELHGNVDTRLRKLAEGEYDGIVLAARRASPARSRRRDLVPVRARGDDPGRRARARWRSRRAPDDSRAAAEAARDLESRRPGRADRRARRGDAPSAPTATRRSGICARVGEDELVMFGYAGLPDGAEWVRDRVSGDPEQPAALGEALAERMLAAGARQILQAAGSAAAEPGVAGGG